MNREVVTYLTLSGLVEPSDLVAGDVEISDISRRNRNLTVRTKQGRSYFLKLAADAERATTLAHEAAVYEWFGQADDAVPLRRYIPRLIRFDGAHPVLITELIGDGQSLREFQSGRKRFSLETAKRIGDALGSLHGIPVRPVVPAAAAAVFSPWRPWVLTLPQPSLEFYLDCSAARIELLRLIHGFPDFIGQLEAVGHTWKSERVIHSDLKFDNLVRAGQSPGRSPRDVRIIDWELAGIGDPCWDVGSVFSEYLSWWLFSIPLTTQLPPPKLLESIRYPLADLQPVIRAFWMAYARRAGVESSPDVLLRATRHAGARLIQRAFEHTREAMTLTPSMVCSMQLSLNLMRSPERGAAYLLGLPAHRP